MLKASDRGRFVALLEAPAAGSLAGLPAKAQQLPRVTPGWCLATAVGWTLMADPLRYRTGTEAVPAVWRNDTNCDWFWIFLGLLMNFCRPACSELSSLDVSSDTFSCSRLQARLHRASVSSVQTGAVAAAALLSHGNKTPVAVAGPGWFWSAGLDSIVSSQLRQCHLEPAQLLGIWQLFWLLAC